MVYIYIYVFGWLHIEAGNYLCVYRCVYIYSIKLVTFVAFLLTQRPDVFIFMTEYHQHCVFVYHLDHLDTVCFG